MYPYIFRILVPFIRNGDLERFPLAKTKRPVDLKLSVKVRLGRYSRYVVQQKLKIKRATHIDVFALVQSISVAFER